MIEEKKDDKHSKSGNSTKPIVSRSFLNDYYICPDCMTNVPRNNENDFVDCKYKCGRKLNKDNHCALLSNCG